MKTPTLALLLASTLAAFAWPPIPYTPSVKVSWPANPDPVSGYILYWSTFSFYPTNGAGAYPPPSYAMMNVGNATSFGLSNLTPGLKLYFVLTAYSTNSANTNALESLPSDESTYTPPVQPSKPGKILLSMESSADPLGPWTPFAAADYPIDFLADGSTAFFRARLEIQ